MLRGADPFKVDLQKCCAALGITDVQCVKVLVPDPRMQGLPLSKAIGNKIHELAESLSLSLALTPYNQNRLSVLGTCAARMAKHAEALRSLRMDPLWKGDLKQDTPKPTRPKKRTTNLQRLPDVEVRAGAAAALALAFKAFDSSDISVGIARPLPSTDLRLVQGVFSLPSANGLFDTRV
jgi:hypothetical protein